MMECNGLSTLHMMLLFKTTSQGWVLAPSTVSTKIISIRQRVASIAFLRLHLSPLLSSLKSISMEIIQIRSRYAIMETIEGFPSVGTSMSAMCSNSIVGTIVGKIKIGSKTAESKIKLVRLTFRS